MVGFHWGPHWMKAWRLYLLSMALRMFNPSQVPENYASHLDDGVTLRNPARQSLFRGLNFTIIQPEPVNLENAIH
jgi:hypothetical protein